MSEAVLTVGTLSDFIRLSDPDPTTEYSVPHLRGTLLTLNLTSPHLEIFHLGSFHGGFETLLENFQYKQGICEALLSGAEVILNERRSMVDVTATLTNGVLHFDCEYTQGYRVLEDFTFTDCPSWTIIQMALAEELGISSINQTWVLPFSMDNIYYGDNLKMFPYLLGDPSGLPVGIDDWSELYGLDYTCNPFRSGTIGEGLYNLFMTLNTYYENNPAGASGYELWDSLGCSCPFTANTHLGKLVDYELSNLPPLGS